MKWITTQHLKQWADTIGSRSALSQLISDLIRASASDISSIRFPTGAASQMRGWDGHLVSLGVPPYVPAGESGWEFGTDKDVRNKANGDYATRTAAPGSINQAAATFVFVSPREWADAETWAAEKQTEGKWKDVKVVDGVALEDWLFLCPAVAARLARDISIMPKVGVRGTDQFWDEYAKQFKPDLTADVLLADRQSQADTIQMRATGTIHIWQADSTEEVIAFSRDRNEDLMCFHTCGTCPDPASRPPA